jgi:S1-C subfamily serine protease
MVRLACVLVLTQAAVVSAGQPRATPWRAAMNEIRPSLVTIRFTTGEPGAPREMVATGVVLNDTGLLALPFWSRDPGPPSVRNSVVVRTDGVSLAATIRYRDPLNRFLLLKPTSPHGLGPVRPIKGRSSDSIPLGEDVLAIGTFPIHGEVTAATGIVSQKVVYPANFGKGFLVDTAVGPGIQESLVFDSGARFLGVFGGLNYKYAGTGRVVPWETIQEQAELTGRKCCPTMCVPRRFLRIRCGRRFLRAVAQR